MVVYDNTLIQVKAAFQQLHDTSGRLPDEVRVRQVMPRFDELHIRCRYGDRTEEMVLK